MAWCAFTATPTPTEGELGDAIAELEATHVILWDQGPEVDAGGGVYYEAFRRLV